MPFVKSQDVMPPRKQEIYDFFLSCAPTGVWFRVDNKAGCKATGMTKHNFSKSVSLMAKNGFIETRADEKDPFGGREARIVKRIEGGKLVPIEGLEEYLAEGKPKKKPFKLIPYAGKENEWEAW